MKLNHFLPALCLLVPLPGMAVAFANLAVSAETVRNIGYHPAVPGSPDQMEVRTIRLVQGLYEKGRRLVDQDYEFLRAGQIALGDLDGDGDTDAAVILYYMKGDRKSTQLAVVLDTKGGPAHVASRAFIEGTEVMALKLGRPFVRDPKTGMLCRVGVVSVEVSNETCCNGQGKTMTYRFEANRLVGQDPFPR
ncbi:MAG: hypothetical protein HGB29_07505 [Chlorobiaceae bacterium]|nr:hypothetical protein [Chlorobiaceae bacterium]NTW74692.1 hypothetical protein [Chlorobiaceae bacterium]